MPNNDHGIAATPREESGFMVRATAAYNTMMEEFAGLNITPGRIKMPGAGGQMFEAPEDPIREFTAVILYQHAMRSYYVGEYAGGNNPPDCGSIDGESGDGIPGGYCARCSLSKYGTGKNGSRACKEQRRLFLLRACDLFPTMLILPPTSIASFTTHLKIVVPKFGKSNALVTRFSLVRETNKGGIVYAQAKFDIDRPLTVDEMPIITKLSEQMKEYSRRLGIESDSENDGGVYPVSDDEYIDPETGEVIQPLTRENV